MNQPLLNAAMKLSKELNINDSDFLKAVEKQVMPTIPSKKEIRHSKHPGQANVSESEEEEEDKDEDWSFELRENIEDSMERLKLSKSFNEVAQYLELIYTLQIEYAQQINQRVYINQNDANELSKIVYMHIEE